MPDDAQQDKPDQPDDAVGKGKPDDPVDDLVATHHELDLGDGEVLAYTATAGRVVLREEVHEDGVFQGHRPKAELFLTAYVKDGDPDEVTRRPVLFAFNGGPGSSSVWLHLGVLGPRRVLMGDAGDLLPPPYGLADNRETLLRSCDLVFVDPVSTGYSRAVEGGKPAEFHGYRRDVDAVGELVRLWTTRNGRWMSPKLLAGESYGTLRVAALADHLQQRYGLSCNGIALISSVLDMSTIRFYPGNEKPYAFFVPTYAAIAHHHGRHGGRPLQEVVDEAVAFSRDVLPPALAAGSRLPREERADVVRRLAALTGLSEDYVDRVDLRIEHQRFFAELLRDEGLVVGRLDGRFTGWDPDGGREHPEEDPSYSAIRGPYSAALNHYVRAELGYLSDLPYEVLTGRVQPWSYEQFEGRGVSVADALSRAMRQNRHLQVHVAFGYHDAATPFTAAEHVLAQLRIPEALRDNITRAYYEAGHMMYVHEPSRLQQSRDLTAWVADSTGGAS